MPIAHYAAALSVFTGKVVVDELEVRKVQTYSQTGENITIAGDVDCENVDCINVRATGSVDTNELRVETNGFVEGDLQVGTNIGGGRLVSRELVVSEKVEASEVEASDVLGGQVTASVRLDTPLQVLGNTVRTERYRDIGITGQHLREIPIFIKDPVRFDVSGVWHNGIGGFTIAFSDLQGNEYDVEDGIFLENESVVSGEEGLYLEAGGWCKFDLSLGLRRAIADQVFGELSVLYFGQSDNPTGTGLKRRLYTFTISALPVKLEIQLVQESDTSELIVETKNFQRIE